MKGQAASAKASRCGASPIAGLIRQAERQGIPAFALRLAASKRFLLAEDAKPLRHRRD